MGITKGLDVDKERVRALVPDWLAIELSYANAKHGGKNPQLTAFDDGLEPGGIAYQDAFGYIGRFNTYFKYVDGEEKLILRASQCLGKLAGTARALVSAVNQRERGLDLARGDALTMKQFEARWYGENDFGKFPVDFDVAMPKMVDEKLAAVRNASGDTDLMGKHALDLFLEEARIFGAFTLEHSLMAEPGISSTDEPRRWTQLTVVN